MRPEPRGMTLGDAMALTAGVASAFAIVRLARGHALSVPIPAQAYLILGCLLLAWYAGMAIAAAALARSAQHGRPVGPGEWHAFLLAAAGIVFLHPMMFLFAEQPLVIRFAIGFETARWIIAGGWTLVLLIALAGLAATRQVVPPWVVASIGLILAVIAIGGPFTIVREESVFFHFPAIAAAQSSGSLLAIQARERIAETPIWLMFALPTVALALRWPGRRSWPWTERAGAIACLPLLAFTLFQRDTFFRPMSGYWFADQAFGLAWLGFVLLLAWWIIGLRSRWVQPTAPAASTSST